MFACSQCKTHYHSECLNISHLPELAKRIEKSKELRKLTENMEDMSKELENIEKHVKLNTERTTSQETLMILETEREKEEILAISIRHQQAVIDDFEKKMEETITKLKIERLKLIEQSKAKRKKLEIKLNNEADKILKKIENTKEAVQEEMKTIDYKNMAMKHELTTMSSDLIQHQNTGQRCKLFTAMKKAESIMSKLKQDMRKLKEDSDIRYDADECEEQLLDDNGDFRSFFYTRDFHSKKGRTAQYHSYLQTGRMEFSSLCLLSDYAVLVTDFNDRSLIIFKDTKKSTNFFDKIPVDSQPWAVAKVSDSTVGITLPYIGIIRLIEFSEAMAVIDHKDIKVGTQCRGIVFNDNNLIVSYWTAPAKIQIIDMCGKVMKTLDKDDNGQHLFVTPFHLALSPDNRAIYVSDFGNDSVLSLTFDGKVKAIYKDDQLKEPYQLTVDRSGTVYVCGASSQNVHQLSSDLKKVKILLDRGHGIRSPVSVTYCQNNRRLYVGMQNSGVIKVFHLALFFK